MLLVTEGRGRINQLGFDKKTSEYVFIHRGKEIWREKGDNSLLDYFNNLRATYSCIDEEAVNKFPIWNKYVKDCDKYE
ncbi:MAG: hypothetical protein MJ179_03895 [Treponema sp.]|nr:hypothetical protein [Treponema sp.]